MEYNKIFTKNIHKPFGLDNKITKLILILLFFSINLDLNPVFRVRFWFPFYLICLWMISFIQLKVKQVYFMQIPLNCFGRLIILMMQFVGNAILFRLRNGARIMNCFLMKPSVILQHLQGSNSQFKETIRLIHGYKSEFSVLYEWTKILKFIWTLNTFLIHILQLYGK